MDTGTPRWRTGAGIVAWILIAVATAALAWTAVGVVAGQGEGSATLEVPSEAMVDPSSPSSGSGAIPTAGEQPPTDDTNPTTADSTTGDDVATSQQVPVLISSSGGSVSVACTSSGALQRNSVTPATGWRHELDDDGSDGTDDEVEVTFVRGDDEEIRVRARCHDGRVEYDLSD
jgi:hypothetical protein